MKIKKKTKKKTKRLIIIIKKKWWKIINKNCTTAGPGQKPERDEPHQLAAGRHAYVCPHPERGAATEEHPV